MQNDDKPRRIYDPSPQHDPRAGWGTAVDLDEATAATVLNEDIRGPNEKQVYGYHHGRVYEFQPDNRDAFHGYPIPGNEAPPAMLREWRDAGKITRVEYRDLIKGRR